MGEISDELKELDFDETYFECLRIAEDWINGVDTDNFEEEGYIAPYAERVLMEKFGIDDKVTVQQDQDLKGEGNMETTEYFNLTIDELLEHNHHPGGYTKEERLLFDEGLLCTFFDDEEEYRAEAHDFQEWIKSRGMTIKVMLATINGRFAVVTY